MKKERPEKMDSIILPALRGTPKQVAWAEKIRNALLRPYMNREKFRTLKPESRLRIEKFLTEMSKIKSARVWISFSQRKITLSDLIADYNQKNPMPGN